MKGLKLPWASPCFLLLGALCVFVQHRPSEVIIIVYWNNVKGEGLLPCNCSYRHAVHFDLHDGWHFLSKFMHVVTLSLYIVDENSFVQPLVDDLLCLRAFVLT